MNPGDPTSRYSRHKLGDDRRSHHRLSLWNELPPPRDPVRVARSQGRRHYNQATGETLFRQSAMPVGVYASRTMERMPQDELLIYWTHRDKLRAFEEWVPVIDYLERHGVDHGIDTSL